MMRLRRKRRVKKGDDDHGDGGRVGVVVNATAVIAEASRTNCQGVHHNPRSPAYLLDLPTAYGRLSFPER